AEVVAFPLADLARDDVAEVVDVADEQRAEFGILQRLLDAAEPVAVQPAIVDAFLEIDAHGAERRQSAAPIVARVDVLGADLQRVARSLVHGGLLLPSQAACADGFGCAYTPRHGRRHAA